LDDVAASSEDQAHGIGQISKGMSEIDKVTQENVINVGKAASAINDIDIQTDLMKDFVIELVNLIGSKNGGKYIDIEKKSVGSGCHHAAYEYARRFFKQWQSRHRRHV